MTVYDGISCAMGVVTVVAGIVGGFIFFGTVVVVVISYFDGAE
jgi:hypothetical protein